MTLRWATRKPTVPGFYFYRTEHGSIDVCRVRQLDIDVWDQVPQRFTEWSDQPIPEPVEPTQEAT